MIFVLPSQRNSTSCSIKLPPSHPRTALSLSLSPHFNSISNLYLFHKLLLYAYQLVISQNVTGSKSNDEIKKQTQTNKVHRNTHTGRGRKRKREIYSHEYKLHAAKPASQPTDTHDIDYYMCKYASFIFVVCRCRCCCCCWWCCCCCYDHSQIQIQMRINS